MEGKERGCSKRRGQQVHANASAEREGSKRDARRNRRKGKLLITSQKCVGLVVVLLDDEVGLNTWRSLLSVHICENKDWYKIGKGCQQVSVTMKTRLKTQ